MTQTELNFTARTRNVMSDAENYALARWMEKHPEYHTTNFDEVASTAAEELGFTVTVANVRHARAVIGLPPIRAARKAHRERTADQVLAYELIRVLKELEFPVPVDLEDIRDGSFSDRR